MDKITIQLSWLEFNTNSDECLRNLIGKRMIQSESESSDAPLEESSK